jgi:tetratricopeptide (TPR) repeat protein
MLLARLDALPPDARQTLQLAAVVGSEFSEEIVSALATDDTDGALRTLQRAELVVPRVGEGGERVLAFRHPLIHEVAYRSLLLSTRRQLHGRIARWLEEHGGEEQVAELAQHYRDSDNPDKARHYLPLAGERAERLNAGKEAKGWFLQAADAFADDAVRRAQMLEAAARQTYLIGSGSEEPIHLLREAITLYEQADAEVAALNGRRTLSRYYWLHGDPVEAERQIGLAIAGLERLPPTPELAYAYSFRSQILMLKPDYRQGEEFARKAIAVAEQTAATGALTHAYNNLGMCLWGVGDQTGHEYLQRSLELALENGLTDDAGRAYANMSGQGNRVFPFGYAGAEELLNEALAYAQRTIPGGVFDQWIRSGHAEFLLVSGRWTESEAAIAAIEWTRAGPYIQVSVAALRSPLASYRGQHDEAAGILGDAADIAIRIGDQQAILPTLVASAQAQTGLGNDADAVAELRRAIDQPGSTADGSLGSYFLFEAADLVTAARLRSEGAGDPTAIAAGVELLARYASALEAAVAVGGEESIDTVRRALFGAAVEQISSLCGPLGVTPPSLENGARFAGRAEGVPTLEDHHRVFDVARIRLWLAEERRDPSLLAGARATFEELGAHPYLARAASLSG